MKVHFDDVTKRVTGYTSIGEAPLGSLDLGEGVDFDFTFDFDEYEVQNSIVVHVGPSVEKLAEQQAELLLYFTGLTEQFIQDKVDDYNTLNGTAFGSVHNCESYSRLPTYTHQVFCEKVWLWSVEVWEAVRAYQATLTAAPTEAEFQAVLDSVIW